MSSLPHGIITMTGVSRTSRVPGAVGLSFIAARLPTDPVGSTSVTFDGVIAGSEIRVYLPDGTDIAGIEACVANQVLTWPVYSSGSPNNIVRVAIVNLDYRLKDFSYTSRVGAQSIPVQMEADKWFSNPA